MKVIITVPETDKYEVFKFTFKDYHEVIVRNESIFDVPTDAIVSPGNSFGFMDGGVDWYIIENYGKEVQERLQYDINHSYEGELLVGQAHVVKVSPDSKKTLAQPRYVIAAPTMRVPMILRESVNVYLATKAALIAASDLGGLVSRVSFTAMGTGVGEMLAEISAKQMKAAVDEVLRDKTPVIRSVADAQMKHCQLFGRYGDYDLQFHHEPV